MDFQKFYPQKRHMVRKLNASLKLFFALFSVLLLFLLQSIDIFKRIKENELTEGFDWLMSAAMKMKSAFLKYI